MDRIVVSCLFPPVSCLLYPVSLPNGRFLIFAGDSQITAFLTKQTLHTLPEKIF
jgi:hypothetical protein